MNQYFKGYYFKCVEGNKALALIPALHIGEKQENASLQVITDHNVYSIPYSDIRFGNGIFEIKIGKNYFSSKGIYLDVESEKCCIHGKLKFGAFQKIKYDIMGIFRHIPCMQCKHSIISMNHSVTGKISINDTIYVFKNGKGYIEGDCGSSFPKEYIWTQCHWENGSLMLAVADIPMLGFHFKGIIGVVMIEGREYRIATYLGAKVISMGDNIVIVKQGRYIFSTRLMEANHQRLYAPVKGKMVRSIHESVSCKTFYKFVCDDRTLLEFTSNHASFEYEMNNNE